MAVSAHNCRAWLLALACAFGACRSASAASPAACLAQPLAEIAIGLERGVPLITLAIDGGAATLVLDTGAERTILTVGAARRLGLEGHYAYARTMHGVGAGEVRPGRLAAGALPLTGYSLLVAPITLPSVGGQAIDGLLGADLLADFDLDLDFVHRRVRFYKASACAAPSWPPPYSSIAAHVSLHRHLFFPVRLDGQDMAAFIDTGSQFTVVDAAAAVRSGLTQAALRLDRAVTVRGAAAVSVGAHVHRFDRLEVAGGVTRDSSAIVARLDLDDADLILGADYLAAHRVWLSYNARTVFVGPRG